MVLDKLFEVSQFAFVGVDNVIKQFTRVFENMRLFVISIALKGFGHGKVIESLALIGKSQDKNKGKSDKESFHKFKLMNQNIKLN